MLMLICVNKAKGKKGFTFPYIIFSLYIKNFVNSIFNDYLLCLNFNPPRVFIQFTNINAL
jgi:hypothetical protein